MAKLEDTVYTEKQLDQLIRENKLLAYHSLERNHTERYERILRLVIAIEQVRRERNQAWAKLGIEATSDAEGWT